MKKPNSPPSVSVTETPKSPPSPSADPFATSDYAPDSLSPSMESVLSDQGSDYSIYTLRFPPSPPPDLKTDCEQGLGFDLSGDSFAAVESKVVSHRCELLHGEGVGDGKSEGDVKNLSGCGVPPETATWEYDEDPPWMTRYILQQEAKRRRKMEGGEKQDVDSKAVISIPCTSVISIQRLYVRKNGVGIC